MLDIQTIRALVGFVLDVLVVLVVLIRGKGKTDTTTIEQLAQKAQAKADKYFAKQCKKHNLQVEDKGGEDAPKNET